MAFADYWNELRGYVPTLSPFLAQKFVNRAWSDIQDADEWSFLEGQCILQVPALISTGSITFVQFTNTIIGDAAASAAWTPLLLGGIPPIVAAQNAAGQPLIGTGRQIRMTNGPLYSVIGAATDGFGIVTLTVDRQINEPSVIGATYQMYRAYFGAPSTDFIRYISVTDFAQGFTIRGRRLTGDQRQLNAIDPQRGSTEDMYFMFTLYADANGMPIKEGWPHPINQQGYIAQYKRRGQALSATVDIPGNFPVNCLLERAKMYAAQWKATQRREPGDDTDWTAAWKTHRDNYERPTFGLLAQSIKIDTSLRTPPPIIRQSANISSPFGSGFYQNHDVQRMLSMFPFLGGY